MQSVPTIRVKNGAPRNLVPTERVKALLRRRRKANKANDAVVRRGAYDASLVTRDSVKMARGVIADVKRVERYHAEDRFLTHRNTHVGGAGSTLRVVEYDELSQTRRVERVEVVRPGHVDAGKRYVTQCKGTPDAFSYGERDALRNPAGVDRRSRLLGHPL